MCVCVCLHVNQRGALGAQNACVCVFVWTEPHVLSLQVYEETGGFVQCQRELKQCSVLVMLHWWLLRLQIKARQSSVSLITLRSRAISSQWQSCKPKLRMAVKTAIKEQAHTAALKPSQSKRDSHHLLQSENTARACPLSSPLLFLAHQVDSCGLCL